MHKKLYTYEHDDGPLFPEPKKLLPKMPKTQVAKLFTGSDTFQKYGYDKALSILLSVLLVFGGYHLVKNISLSDVLGGIDVVRSEYSVGLVEGIEDKETGRSFYTAAGLFSVKEMFDEFSRDWYTMVCEKIAICSRE